MTSLEATYLFGYVDTSTIPSDLFCVFRKARQRTVNWTGSKMTCVELCNFHFCCAFIFCQPMKKFEFFGASRATRQRHFKTSSTGDENESRITCMRMLRINQSKITRPQPSAQTTRVKQVAPTHSRLLEVIQELRFCFGGFRKNISPELHVTISYS